MATTKYPTSELAKRPFRLWDAKAKRAVPYRFYAISKNAHQGALLEARWGAVGTTIEVYHANTGKLLGQYTRKLHTIAFTGE